jgi:YVTN family beta-propeller protein
MVDSLLAMLRSLPSLSAAHLRRAISGAVVMGALLHAQPALAQTCALVANELDGTVSVLDTEAMMVTATVPVGGRPTGVGVVTTTPSAYVTNSSPDAVAVLDAATTNVIKTINIPACSAPLCGPGAVAISTDGRRAYVPAPVDDGSHVLSVIDTSTKAVTDSVTIRPDAAPRSGGVAVTADGRFACVSGYLLMQDAGESTTAALYSDIVDLDTKRIVPRMSVLGPSGPVEEFLTRARTAAAIAPGGMCYVTDGFSGNVLVIAMSENTVVKEIPLGSTLTGIAITPDGHSVYVSAGTFGSPPASKDEGEVFVIDTISNEVTATIRQPGGHFFSGVAVSPSETFAMITDSEAGRVLVADTATKRLTASIPVGSGPGGVAIGCGAGAQCVGDCNSDRSVTVDELLTMVNIGLEIAPSSDCTAGDFNGDGQITVDEILTAVNNLLDGCAAA